MDDITVGRIKLARTEASRDSRLVKNRSWLWKLFANHKKGAGELITFERVSVLDH